MSLARFSITVVAFVLVSTHLASGNPSGLMDGVGGGGQLAPEREQMGQGLADTYREGVKLLADGECKRAEKKFKVVLDKVPRNSDANYLRGVALQCQHRYKKALSYFRRAKRDDASYFLAYTKLGISYLALGGTDEAKGELEELASMHRACGERCPRKLLKAEQSLAEAIADFEGVEAVSVEKDEKPIRRFDPIQTPR